MIILAGLSIVLMLTAAAWQSFFKTTTPTTATVVATTTPLANNSETATSSQAASTTLTLTPVGVDVLTKLATAYTNLNAHGAYTPEAGSAAARTMATTLRPDVTAHVYIASELTTTPDTSNTRLLSYRSDLQNALKPLLRNTQYELSVYAHYIATQDPADLTTLQESASNYHTAALNAAKVTVPESAVEVHINVLNALERFGSTLAVQTVSVSDPYASAALLSSYNTAESDVFRSFGALAKLFRDKIPS